MGVALIAIPILPNFPRTTKWLSEEEKALAIWRLEEDVGEDDWVSEEQSMWHGAKLAFTDIKTYVLVRPLWSIALFVKFSLTEARSLAVLAHWYRLIGRCDQLPASRGQDSWIQLRPNSATYEPPLRPLRYYFVPERLACRSNRREVLAHHTLAMCCPRRVHHRCSHHGYRPTILCYHYHGKPAESGSLRILRAYC